MDYRSEVLALYHERFGRPAPGEKYPPEVWHNAPALMRQNGWSAEVALEAAMKGMQLPEKSFAPRAEFPEK